ncbi:metallophosphoesterase [Candidatus Woesearchaeota archaeon]|nr:metallophosphoesterase [Candidatus Woesearchaeota archaeon]
MIGIISDTHEQYESILKAVEIFKLKNVEFVVHCGDVISPGMLKHFEGLNMKFVFGNCDGERKGLIETSRKYGWNEINDALEFEHKNKKFYVVHNPILADEAVQSEKYDYVFHGHTHEKRDEKIGKTRIINPGRLLNPPRTIVILDVTNDSLEFIPIE